MMVPDNCTGLRLCKMVRGKLVVCEPVQFVQGAAGADTVLRRAHLAGKVGPIGEAVDYWADLLNADDDWFETIALDSASWGALKNHWMRCRIER